MVDLSRREILQSEHADRVINLKRMRCPHCAATVDYEWIVVVRNIIAETKLKSEFDNWEHERLSYAIHRLIAHRECPDCRLKSRIELLSMEGAGKKVLLCTNKLCKGNYAA